jgi:type II secretory pathway pseudopilin PulG
MKPTSRTAARHQSGMSLIEAVSVILLLGVVISVVFSRTQALRHYSDRTACLNNISNMQMVVRAFQRLHDLPDQAPLNTYHQFVGYNKEIPTEPLCPSTGHYTYADAIPLKGHLALTCSLSQKAGHEPDDYQNW